MHYYASENDIRAMQAIVSRAETVIRSAEAAIDAAQVVKATEPGEARDEAQGIYDHHHNWVIQHTAGLSDAAKNLP